MEPKRIVRDGYDRLGESYRDADEPNPIRRWFLDEALARIPVGGDVLELGCGPGIDAVELTRDHRYTGVDISSTMIAATARRVPGARLIEADLATLELTAGSFDAIVSLYAFGHVPAGEHEPLFERLFRWLRPGGVLCASFPVGAGDDVVADWMGVPMFFGGIGRVATERGLRRAGFDIEFAEERTGEDPSGGAETFLWAIVRKP